MKNKGLIITLIVILCTLAASLISLLVVLLMRFDGFHFSMKKETYKMIKSEEYELSSVNEISTDLVSSDIDIKLSNDDKIKVEYYGKNDEDITYNYSSNNLNIIENRKNRFCIGFCYNGTKVIVYLPENYDKNLTLKTISGDVGFENSYENSKTSVNTTSGDIKVINSKTLKVSTTSGDVNVGDTVNTNIKTVSGDVKVNSVNESLRIETVSGDIDIDSINITKESSINTISGDVEINKSNDIYIETKTTSGDIDILNNNRKSDYVLKIKTVSGDIEVN